MNRILARSATLAALGMIAAAPAVAPAVAKDTMGTPSGTITLTAQSADVGVGYSWGEGVLRYDHHSYKFKVSGADIAALGYSKVVSHGTVYNLKHLHDFDGTYGALAGEATLDKGLGGAVLSNTNGVRLKMDSAAKGARLAAGAQGLTFTLEN